MPMKGPVLAVWLSSAVITVPAAGQQTSSSPAWANPEVWKSNSVSVRIDADIRGRKLLVQSDSVACDDGAVRITAHLYTGHDGNVRKYVVAGGHDDAFVTVLY